MTDNGLLRPLRLDLSGTIGDWIGSLFLTAAGVASLLILSIRRHRQDDYRATYRIWIWAAVSCFLMSIDQTAGVRAAVPAALRSTFAISPAQAVAIFAAGLLPFALGIGGRLGWDVRYCRSARASFVACAIAYGTAAVLAFASTLQEHNVSTTPMLGYACAVLTGHLLLFMTTLSFGRFVLLEAEDVVRTPTVLETAHRRGQHVTRHDAKDNSDRIDVGASPNTGQLELSDTAPEATTDNATDEVDVFSMQPNASPDDRRGNRKRCRGA